MVISVELWKECEQGGKFAPRFGTHIPLTVLPLLSLTCPDLKSLPFGFKSLQVLFFPFCLVLSRLLQPHLPILDFRNLFFFTKSPLLGGRAAGTLDAETWTSVCYTVM